jgi:hypothetical protein
MALKDRRAEIYEYIKDHLDYLKLNKEIFEIYEGNLEPYVQRILRESVNQRYYNSIKHRVFSFNILKRIVDKLAKVYAKGPNRRSTSQAQEVVEFYEKEMNLNWQMNLADEYANLFKGYALEPYVHEGKAQLRVLPYDRFLVISDDSVDPMKETVFVKMMGEKKVGHNGEVTKRSVFQVYTNEEFDAFDSDLETYTYALKDNEGVNPYGIIPFIYGNRSRSKLIPTQDTDLINFTKMLPVMLTDLGGAIMYQCFSIIYGVDLDLENLTVSPDVIWNLKSDTDRDVTPTVGTIKPDVDIQKVLNFIQTSLIFLLETRGIRAGSVGSIDAGNTASGISKIVDEMDTFEIRKQNIQFFKKDEQELWAKLAIMHNEWIASGELTGLPLINLNSFFVDIDFDEPKPLESRQSMIETRQMEVDLGVLDKKTALEQLYPDLTEEQIEERLVLIKNEESLKVFNGRTTENSNSDSQGL